MRSFIFLFFFVLSLVALMSLTAFAIIRFYPDFAKINFDQLTDSRALNIIPEVTKDPQENLNEVANQITDKIIINVPKDTVKNIVVSTLPLNTDLNQKVQEEDSRCLIYEIASGKFKSNKCYQLSDYTKLSDLYSDYRNNLNTVSYSEKRIEIICNDSDFFEDSCNEAKRELSSAMSKISILEPKIQEVINRGK
jgi:hypothetical protein